VAGAALAAFLVCATVIQFHNDKKAAEARAADRKARITQMADEIKKCRPGPLPKGCLSDAEKKEVGTAADQYEKLGDSAADQHKKLEYYADAARAYIKLGDWDKARGIIVRDLRAHDNEATPAPADADSAGKVEDEMRKGLSEQIADPGRCMPRAVPEGCPNAVERNALLASARSNENGKEYKTAGLQYAELGEAADADRMIAKCKEGDKMPDGTVVNKDPQGAEEIIDRFNMRAEALRLSVQKK
jgi:tetratricopeptide (TPR) repeat protein